MIQVALDDSPLQSGHAARGVGTYTRNLTAGLKEVEELEVLSLTKETLKTAQLVHYPYFDLFFPTLPLRKPKPSVVTIHDVIPLLYPDQYPRGKRGSVNFLRQKLALRSVSAIITDSEASKVDIVKHLKVKPDKISVIYLAASPDLQSQSETDIAKIRQKYHLPGHYILYVGDINYNKNLPQLIKALKFLPDNIDLVLVGKNFFPHLIPEWQAIETQLALSNVANRVHFIPTLEVGQSNDLAAIYSGALAYVQPSLYEGFGLPVLEAMQCKTPVVATQTSSLIEVGGDHAIFTQTDAESLATGIKTVSDWSKTKRQSIVKEAFAWSQGFSWKKAALETAAVYRKVV